MLLLRSPRIRDFLISCRAKEIDLEGTLQLMLNPVSFSNSSQIIPCSRMRPNKRLSERQKVLEVVPQKYSLEDKFSGDVMHVSGRMESIPEEDRYISRFLNFSLKPTTPRRLRLNLQVICDSVCSKSNAPIRWTCWQALRVRPQRYILWNVYWYSLSTPEKVLATRTSRSHLVPLLEFNRVECLASDAIGSGAGSEPTERFFS